MTIKIIITLSLLILADIMWAVSELDLNSFKPYNEGREKRSKFRKMLFYVLMSILWIVAILSVWGII